VDLNHARLPIPPFRLTIRGHRCIQPRELREVLVSQSTRWLSMVAAAWEDCAKPGMSGYTGRILCAGYIVQLTNLDWSGTEPYE